MRWPRTELGCCATGETEREREREQKKIMDLVAIIMQILAKVNFCYSSNPWNKF